MELPVSEQENSLAPFEAHEKDIEFKKQQEDHQFQLAMKAIDAKLANNEQARSYMDRMHTKMTWFFVFIILCLLIFALGALYLNKEAVLVEIFKYAIIAFGFGGAGYAAGTKKRGKS
ncbi:MAG: hypothetical protein MSH25_00690 [Desulfovibrio sp.]|uniref:hypothetical protein n=1 Tax=Desulfovibrio sp. TaxID=885 RepID=UPI0025BA5454|nr:hypothetical protein [Desulfovibrio sp.]MCI7567886.1 hypothetical protein [Desulfovibrio sp.]